MRLLLLALWAGAATARAEEGPTDEAGADEGAALPEPIDASANPTPTIDLDFPASLAARGHTQEAWLEYERVAHGLPPGLAADRARFLAGALLLDAARADVEAGLQPGFAAANHFAQAPVSAESQPLFRLMVVEAHYEAHQYVLAETQLAAFGPGTPASLDPALRYREAWLRLRQGDPAAPDYFAAVPGEGPLAQAGDALSSELRALPPLPTRSPLAAGLLSALLPGAGQLYAGEPRDAASALLLNGLFIGGTTALIRQRAWPAAALTGVFTLGFYSGNVLSAVNAARRRNQRLERARLDTLAAEWELHVGLVPAAPGAPLEPELQLGRP
ncbi:MAG: hypothetical protein H6741_16660 [Alphaproteobacteria bacterium]|nr:hypothetical protein [Alphaproteobacteria bacterium]MCB9794347.1 hypothetical protein [Alphaproteobacteria bacterium]